ncbi:hypothetical protein JST97_12175 [bacterium]|nr:hypothetical protein [bacterium]
MRVKILLGLLVATLVYAFFWATKSPPFPDNWKAAESDLPAGGFSLDSRHSGDFGIEFVPPGTPRMDVYRRMISTTDDEGNTENEPADYEPLGVYLGRGYFYDINDNLSLIAERAFEERKQPRLFHSIACSGGFWWNNYEVEGTDGKVDGGSTVIEHKADGEVFVDGPLLSNVSIKAEPGRRVLTFNMSKAELVFHKWGETINWGLSSYEIQRNRDEVHCDGPLLNDHFLTKTAEGFLTDGSRALVLGKVTRWESSVEGTTNLVRTANRLRLQQSGFDQQFRVD